MNKNTSVPTSAENGTVQKSDAVLPLRRGTTVIQLNQAVRDTAAHEVRYYHGGTDVKNYIRSYYRDTAVLGMRATVLRL